MSFDYNQLKPNDLVDVVVAIVRDPQTGRILMHDTHPGNVVNAYGDGADILLSSPSLGRHLVQWCVHVDDERCQQVGPIEERIKESRDDVTGTPGSGVFRLSRNQTILIGLEDRLAAQEKLLNDLLARMTAMEGRIGDNAPIDKPSQRRRRPLSRSAQQVISGEHVPDEPEMANV